MILAFGMKPGGLRNSHPPVFADEPWGRIKEWPQDGASLKAQRHLAAEGRVPNNHLFGVLLTGDDLAAVGRENGTISLIGHRAVQFLDAAVVQGDDDGLFGRRVLQ